MLEAVAEFLLTILCGMTGHGILWAVTLGRWKPFEKGTRKEESATFVGLLFWLLVGAAIVFVFIMR